MLASGRSSQWASVRYLLAVLRTGGTVTRGNMSPALQLDVGRTLAVGCPSPAFIAEFEAPLPEVCIVDSALELLTAVEITECLEQADLRARIGLAGAGKKGTKKAKPKMFAHKARGGKHSRKAGSSMVKGDATEEDPAALVDDDDSDTSRRPQRKGKRGHAGRKRR